MNLKRPLKILHIADMHLRHLGRLFYSTGRKISLGFIKNNINLLQLGDRDLLSGTLLNRNSFLYDAIKKSIINFNPDIVLFGHVDNLEYNDFTSLKEKFKNIIFSQYFVDTLDKNFINFEKHKSRFLSKSQFCDINFVTTNPSNLEFVDLNKTFYLQNIVDSSIDYLKNFNYSTLPYNVFFALSHGQHRGVLKSKYIDERENFIKYIKFKIKKPLFFGLDGVSPVWGSDFFDALSKSKMGINYSRGSPTKYYSSDRIASIMGNGLMCFLQKKYSFEDFFIPDKEAVFFDSKKELVSKIKFYSANDNLRKKIAKIGHKKYHSLFNSTLVTKYMLSKILGIKISEIKAWMI